MVWVRYDEIEDTYNEIKQTIVGRQACTVMILVANDIDAMASTKIFTQILRDDNIAYTMRPVSNVQHVQEAYKCFITSDIKLLVMINCGATINVKKLLNLDTNSDLRVLILDNHRPIHISNIHSRQNVIVFDEEEEIAKGDIHDYDKFGNRVSYIPSDGSDMSDQDLSDDEDDDDEDDDDESVGSNSSSDSEFQEDGGEGIADADQIDTGDADDEEDTEGGDVDQSEVEEADDAEDEEAHDNGNDNNSVAIDTNADTPEVEIDDDNNEININQNDAEDDMSAVVDAAFDQDDERVDTSRESVNTDDKDDKDEDEEIVIGRKRSTLAKAHDPAKKRRMELHRYYRRLKVNSLPSSFILLKNFGTQRKAHVPLDTIWNAILGVTDQYQQYNIDEETYLEISAQIKNDLIDHLHMARERVDYSVGTGDDRVVIPGAEAGHIEEGNDYRLPLYRHWSLYDSLFHSHHVAMVLPIWNNRGSDKLHAVLARIGVSLQQSNQLYNYMSPKLKEHFRQQVVTYMKIDSSDDINADRDTVALCSRLMGKSFYRYNSFKNPIAAEDVVLASVSLLEMCRTLSDIDTNATTNSSDISSSSSSYSNNGNSNRVQHQHVSRIEAFNDTYDCLNMRNEELLSKGIASAIAIQKAIVSRAISILDEDDGSMRSHHSTFHFAFINNNENSFDFDVDPAFERPSVLKKLGHYIMDVKCCLTKKCGGWRKKHIKPLLLLSKKRDTYVIVSISPLDVRDAEYKGSDVDDPNYRENQDIIQRLTLFQTWLHDCCADAAKDAGVYPLKYNTFDRNVIELDNSNGIVDDFLYYLNAKLYSYINAR